jgi:hypothetical protein
VIDDKCLEEFKAEGRHNNEVHRRDFRKIIAKDGSSSLTWRTIPSLVQMFGDSRLSNIEAEFQQFSVDPGRDPELNFVIHAPDKRA